MITKTLSAAALSLIDTYRNFKLANAICSVPYYNNKTRNLRGALRAYVGKGSPKDIYEEIEIILLKDKVDFSTLTGPSLHKVLVDHNIGIDCSALAYYTLSVESEDRKLGPLSKNISFIYSQGLFGKMKSNLNPERNCDVLTFADERNSKNIPLTEVLPGDIVAMTAGPEDAERNHILVVHQVEYEEGVPLRFHYTHAVAYPEDGLYGTGMKHGWIEILDSSKPLVEQRWSENDIEGEALRIYRRAQKSLTQLRRLNWF